MYNVQRDELFKKIQNNKEAYKQFLEKNKKIDEEYQNNFPGDKSQVEREKYNHNYKEKLKILRLEKENLDSEWEKLNQELQEFLKQ